MPLPIDFSSFEIWRADSNDRSLATKIAEPNSLVFTDTALGTGVTKYYWCRTKNLFGQVSGWFPSSSTGGIAGSTNDSDGLLDLLKNVMVWQGDWEDAPVDFVFKVGSVVRTFQGLWLAIVENTNSEPNVLSTNWIPLTNYTMPTVWSGGQTEPVYFWDTFSVSGGILNSTPDIAGGSWNTANGYYIYGINSEGYSSSSTQTDYSKSGGYIYSGDANLIGFVVRNTYQRVRVAVVLAAIGEFHVFMRLSTSANQRANVRVKYTDGVIYVQQYSSGWVNLGYMSVGSISVGDTLVIEDAWYSMKVIFNSTEIGEFTGLETALLKDITSTYTYIGFNLPTVASIFANSIKIEAFPQRGLTGVILLHDKFGGAVDALAFQRTPDTVGNAHASTSDCYDIGSGGGRISPSFASGDPGANTKYNRLDGLGKVKVFAAGETTSYTTLGAWVKLSVQAVKTTLTLRAATHTTLYFGLRAQKTNSYRPLFIIKVVNGATITLNHNIATRTATPVLHEFASISTTVADGDTLVIADDGTNISVTYDGVTYGPYAGVDGTLYVNNSDKDMALVGETSDASQYNESFLDEILIETL